MIYTTKKCPYCNHTYSFMQPKSYSYGSPLQVCRRCGKYYVDKDFKEIAISGIRKIDTMRITPFSIIASLLFTPLFVSSIYMQFYQPDNMSLFALITFGAFDIFAFYSIYNDCSSFKERQKYLIDEQHRSIARLKNPSYALTLKNLGYDVPKQYLYSDNNVELGNSSPMTFENQPLVKDTSSFIAKAFIVIVTVFVVLISIINT